MKKITLLISAALLSLVNTAHAGIFNFTGNIEFHNDVIFTHFTVESDATNVRVWTDSFMSATNFDPITALWAADGTLIAQNDDNDDINPSTQTYYDSGFALPTLAAGDYIFSVATFDNWATSTNLADGFIFDTQTPIVLSEWNQPANHLNMGSFWSVWVDGVDRAVNDDATNVPEPSSLILLGLSLLAFGFRKVKQA